MNICTFFFTSSIFSSCFTLALRSLDIIYFRIYIFIILKINRLKSFRTFNTICSPNLPNRIASDNFSNEITPETKSWANEKYESSARYPTIISYGVISIRKCSFMYFCLFCNTSILPVRSIICKNSKPIQYVVF